MTERSRKLQRQFSKLLKAEDAESRLAALAELLKQTDAEANAAQIDMLSRFPDFFTSVEKSYEEYEAQAKLAQLNLEMGSAELNAANMQLESLNATIATMLDTLGQGLFSFGADGICSPIYSKACLTLIEGAPAGKQVAEVLTSHPPQQEVIRSLLKVLFNGASSIASLDDVFDLFPRAFTHSKGLSLTLHYRPIYDMAGALRSVLVVVTDRTEEMVALQQSEERDKRAMRVLRIAKNPNVFIHFYRSAACYFDTAGAAHEECGSLEQMQRDIHTLKGSASVFYLPEFTSALHVLETDLASVTQVEQARQKVQASAGTVRAALALVKKEADRVLGEGFDSLGSVRAVPLDALKQFAEELRALPHGEALAEKFVVAIVGEPIGKQLDLFVVGLRDLADRYGKEVGNCTLAGENFSILTENYEDLFASFSHVARNILSHAIEPADVRADYGKTEPLALVIHTEHFAREGKDWWRVSFTDDGAGIDEQKLRARLAALGRDATTLTRHEVLQSIFLNNVSTKDEVDEISGRGVGMSAIKECAEALGGTAYVESELHRFTRTVVEVPFLWG